MNSKPGPTFCIECGEGFNALRKTAKYCSLSCKRAFEASIARLKRKENPNYGKKVKISTCKQCNKSFEYHQTKTQSFCSRGCSVLHLNEKSKVKITSINYANCECCNKLFIQRFGAIACKECRKGKTYSVIKSISSGARTKKCIICDVSFSCMADNHHGQTCSDDCSAEVRRKHKRIARSKRRAIERSIHSDNIDPIDIFRRDNWECQCCSKKLKLSDRGLYIDSAPELDHIIPLSKGGKHTSANTQLLCRKCNAIKGDGYYHGEQLRLVG